MADNIMEAVQAANDTTFGIWFLIGAIMVFFMQCGFAMVEAGFTRIKNTGNIIMKNLMDFCIGTVVFMVLGFGLLAGEDALFGLIGIPNLDIFTNWETFNWSSFFFNLVFCATAATIVSGAMAERTKFISYCIYSGLISLVVYPIECHWVWGGGWLSQLNYHDYAGSTVIHMVGGIAAFIGAAFLGARIGKYGKDGKPRAILGHSMTIGSLGVFILWFGWYGFNGAAAVSVDELAWILVNTTIAPALACVTTMTFTWIRHGKPDVSMTLNAALAGLVAITAPCDCVDGLGAAIIGIVAGFLVCFGVWLLDYKLKVDDPVGAVAVHGFNGIWGGIAVGLFSVGGPNEIGLGLFSGGGFQQLGIQILGVLAIAAWTVVTMVVLFWAIKHTVGLRVSREEELKGLDAAEHGLASAYAGFVVEGAIPSVMTTSLTDSVDDVSEEIAVPVTKTVSEGGDHKMSKVVVVANQDKLDSLKGALNDIGVSGLTYTQVLGFGVQKGATEYYRGTPVEATLRPKMKLEMVVSKIPVDTVVDTIKKVLYTGHIGDGKIFVYDVEKVVKVRTGEIDYDALQD